MSEPTPPRPASESRSAASAPAGTTAPGRAVAVAEDPHTPEAVALPRAGASGDHAATLPVSAAARTGTLHLVGHAHIDPVWLWQWQEGLAEVRQTWRSALDRMREYPEFRFTASSAAFYAWVEAHDPALFEEIRGRVAEGRWELAGGWWVEPDVNIPSGESFVRQALVGQRWFQSRFGTVATVGFNPDGFGHAAGLPQILARCGLRRYVFMRPQVHERDLPRIFWWTADDGSRVLAFRILWEYGTWVPELDRWVRRCATELGELSDDLLVLYGVGNHGGGPTRANLDSLRALQHDPELPTLEHATMGAFFDRLEPRAAGMPAVSGELQRHAPGCYSAHSGIKHANRHAESLLGVTERWCAVASVVGGEAYPADELRRAWQGVLFNQFHDILAGSAIAPAYDDAHDELGESRSIAGRALSQATSSVARRIAIPETGGTALVCFNPHARPARPLVELEVGTGPAGGPGAGVALEDDGGVRVPVQVVRSEATVRGGRMRIAFTADLPPLGYRLYRVVTGTTAAERFPTGCVADDRSLANDLVRVMVDATTGGLTLHDRRTGLDLLAGDGHVAMVMADGYDTWGHGLDRFDRPLGTFRPDRVRLAEHGPVLSVLRVESRFGESRLIQHVVLRPGDPRVEVRCTLTWNERWRALKLRFPVVVEAPEATFEAAYATIRRPPTGEEVPGGRWADISGRLAGTDRRAGLSVITDAKHGYDAAGADLGITAVRSPVFAHHEPYLPLEGEAFRFQDQGPQAFRYVLLPHDGDWRAAGVTRAAADLHEAPIAVPEPAHPGDHPTARAFAQVTPEHVELRVLKQWEDGPELVVRLFETVGRAAEARLDLPVVGRSDRVAIGAHELLTFVVPFDPEEPLRAVSALEWPEPDSRHQPDG